MTISFYDLSVPTFLQTVRAIGGFLGRTLSHCGERARSGRLRERPAPRRHGALPFPSGGRLASCGLGAGGGQDRGAVAYAKG